MTHHAQPPQPHEDPTAPPGSGGAFFVPPPAGAPVIGAATHSAAVNGAHHHAAARGRAEPTRFPTPLRRAGWHGLLYTLGRTQIIAYPPANWILAAAAITASALVLRGGAWPWLAGALLAAALLLRLLVWRVVRRDGVRFAADASVALPNADETAALPPQIKLPVYVSGCLEVGARVQRFAMLPGFYRSFATREHALLCLCQSERRLLVAAWPEVEVGLWYAFVQPRQIRALHAGTLRHGRVQLPALALEVDAVPTRGRVRRRAVETLYIAGDAANLGRIARDLLLDAPGAVLAAMPAAAPAPLAAAAPARAE